MKAFRFDHLPSLTRAEAAAWNWHVSVAPTGAQWRKCVAEALGCVAQKPAGVIIRIAQTHLVETQRPEVVLNLRDKREVFLGRGLDNDIVLSANAVANRHARLFLENGRLLVEDLGGALGTYVGDRKLKLHEPAEISEQDHFTIFPFNFRARLEQTWTPAEPAELISCEASFTTWANFEQSSPAGTRRFAIEIHPRGSIAQLEIDGTFLDRLVAAALGPLRFEPAFVSSDEAVFEFVVLAMLERVNRDVQLGSQFLLRRSPDPLRPRGPGILMTASVRLLGMTGLFRLFLPLDGLKRDAPAKLPRGLPSAFDEVSWSFLHTAGSVVLSREELGTVERGDVLLIDGEDALLLSTIAERGWRLKRQDNSGVFLLDNWFEMNATTTEAAEPRMGRADLDQLPLRLYVVLGEKELTLGEVRNLTTGSVLELSTAPDQPVRLVAAGRVIGEGELVEIEGRLGVKVIDWRIP